MFHYTDNDGFKAIGAQAISRFKAFEPQGPPPDGAYFTTLSPGTKNLARRIRVPVWKLESLFAFSGQHGLVPLDGRKGRGEYIFYSAVDYNVPQERQLFQGQTRNYLSEGRQ